MKTILAMRSSGELIFVSIKGNTFSATPASLSAASSGMASNNIRFIELDVEYADDTLLVLLDKTTGEVSEYTFSYEGL